MNKIWNANGLTVILEFRFLLWRWSVEREIEILVILDVNKVVF